MARGQPHVQAPRTVAPGEVFQVRTLIGHPMETGLRKDETGTLIPRDIINRFTCRYQDDVVFAVDLHEAMAANPFLSFYVRAQASGILQFRWEADDGAVFTLETPVTVEG